MRIKVRGKKVLVAPMPKEEVSPTARFIAQASNANSQGVIRYLGDEVNPELKVGMVVYFIDERQSIVIEGFEMMVMSDDNIVCYRSEDAPQA